MLDRPLLFTVVLQSPKRLDKNILFADFWPAVAGNIPAPFFLWNQPYRRTGLVRELIPASSFDAP
jgi:hypothetical protein